MNQKLAEVGVLKAEVKGKELKIDEHLSHIKNLEIEMKSKDDHITHLKEVEADLREELKQKAEEISKNQYEIRELDSDFQKASQSIDEINLEIPKYKERIKTLEKIETKLNEEIKNLKSTIEAKNQELVKAGNVQDEIKTIDAEKQSMEEELIKLREGILAAEVGLISNVLPNLIKGDQQALAKISEILSRIKRTAIIGLPLIELLPQVLSLDDIKSTYSIRIMTYIDETNEKDMSILKEYKAKSNVDIRKSDQKNLWGVIIDQSEMLIAPGDAIGIPVGFVITDEFQIEILGSVLYNIWAKCKKIYLS